MCNSCDERIAKVQAKIDAWNPYFTMMNLLLPNESTEKHRGRQDKIKNYENNINLIKVEKLIYQTLIKPNNNKLFPLLLQKYESYMTESYALGEEMVKVGEMEEGDYIKYSKESLDQHKYIKTLCSIGGAK